MTRPDPAQAELARGIGTAFIVLGVLLLLAVVLL